MSTFNKLSYNGINTKVRAMKRRLVSEDDYIKIASLDTTADFILFLKNHQGYKDIFTKYNEHELHRYDVERIISYAFYRDYTKLYRFASQIQRRDLDLFFLRQEVIILKNCLYNALNKESSFELSLYKEFFDRHSDINITALSTAEGLEEYIHLLKGSEFYPLFIRLQNASVTNIFDYEIQLDIYYFKRVWKFKDKQTKGNTLKAVTHRLGTEIDLLNIIWLYRSKHMYDVNPADLLSYIIPINYRLTKDKLLSLIKSSSLNEFVELIKTTPYKETSASLLDGTIETTYQSIIEKIYKDNKAKFPASMSVVNHYLHKKEIEISRLTTALECIRYGLGPNETLKHIYNN